MRLAAMGALLVSCIIPAQPRGGGGYGGGPSAGDPVAGAPSSSGENAAGSGENAAGGGGGAPAGPVSVEIRSQCPQTVHVFYGDKPKFGSGTYSTIESNSVESHTFNAGDQMWIVDESENGIASTSVGPGTREIDVTESCASLTAQ